MKSNRANRASKTQRGLLLDVARTIGSTLGTLAAKTGGVSKHPARHVLAKKTLAKPIKSRKRRNP